MNKITFNLKTMLLLTVAGPPKKSQPNDLIINNLLQKGL